MFEKLKILNKKWFYFIFIIAILGIGGVIAGKLVDERYEMKSEKAYPVLANGINLDLLYLENTKSLQLTQDQAKELLPLVEKLGAKTETDQLGLVQKIYTLLNPQQYLALVNKEGTTMSQGRKDSPEHGHKNELVNVKEKAMGDVVIKMLKDIAAGHTFQIEPMTQENTVTDSIYKTE